MRRLVLTVIAIAALTAPAAALATEHVYWGYNTMNNSNPPANTCGSLGSGLACESSYNYYDYSRVEHNSGGSIFFGFQNSAKTQEYGKFTSGLGELTILWSDWGAPHYNTPDCHYDYVSGNPGSYIQCRSLIYP